MDGLGCEVSALGNIPNYQYDCVDSNKTHCPKNNGLNFMHNICLGAVTEQGPVRTFYSL